MTTQTPARTRPTRDRTDFSIVLTAGVLLVIGLVMKLSASSVKSSETTGSAFTLFAGQFIWAAIGVGALVFCWRLDYRRLKGLSYLAVPIAWGMLVLVLLPGVGAHIAGARRWISVGPFTFQPSEFAKIALILFGADVLSRKQDKLDDWRHIAVPFLAAVGFTGLLIMLEPDFGTTMIIGLSALALCYLAGASLRALGGMAGIAFALGVPVMLGAGYRRERLFSFLAGGTDCLNSAYQTCQGLVALGSGNFFGLGLGSSRQKYLFLPNADTDFIFAILGEETGLAGTLVVLAGFSLLLWLGIRAARRANDMFGFLVASGVTAWITLQVLINVGTVTGLLPITGVPLPLISFGGTSLLVSMAGIGLVASVSRRGSRKPRRAAS